MGTSLDVPFGGLPGAGVLMAVLGACFGSFLNVVIYRLPRRLPVVRPRSRCPHCRHVLRWIELVPVASYVRLRGRCRRCGAPLSPAYPLVEAGTAVLFVACLEAFGWSTALARALVLAMLLVAAAEIDRRHGIIPNRLLVAGAGLGLLLAAPGGGRAVAGVVLAALASGGALLGLREFSHRVAGRPGMGMGDVKLAATTALFLGWENLWVLYLAALLGGALGLAGLCTGRLQRTSRLPFAPFVAAGTVLDLFWLPSSILPLPW